LEELKVSKKTEIYKNVPLVETVFEIRFPVELAIECNRDKLYKKIKIFILKF